jgi:cell division protein FtsL
MITMANENYINPINQLISKFAGEIDLEKFADLMNETNQISSSVLQAKDKLFLYDFSTFYSLHDKTSGEVVDVVPRELTVLLMPFKNLLQNMVFLCEGLSGTIQAWHKEQVEWRSKSLELTNNKLNRQNQFLTILVAFALSILFFMSSDPYKLYQLEKVNDGLSSTVETLKKEISDNKKTIEQGYSPPKTSPKSDNQVPPSQKDKK